MLNDNQTFTVNLQGVLSHPLTPTYIKAAIYKGMCNTFLTFGEFLQELSADDLLDICSVYDEFFNGQPNDELLKKVAIIALTLAHLEGVFDEKDEDLDNFIKVVAIGSSCESLSRLGLIELNRAAVNFSSNPKDNLAKITQKGKDYYASKKGDDVQDS